MSTQSAEAIIKAAQIANTINEVYDGVAQSKLGPVRRPPKGDEPNVREVIDNLAFQTFITVLNNVFPKSMEGKIGVTDGSEQR